MSRRLWGNGIDTYCAGELTSTAQRHWTQDELSTQNTLKNAGTNDENAEFKIAPRSACHSMVSDPICLLWNSNLV